MQRWTVRTCTESQTRALGKRLGQLLPSAALVLLEGTLGAGKTVFSQGVARGVGVPETVPVNSPTYTLLNHYPGAKDLYHFDLYRLGDPEELFELGFEEFAYGEGVALVEWSERIGLEEADHLKVRLRVIDTEHRELSFIAQGPIYGGLLDLLAAGENVETSVPPSRGDAAERYK